MEGPSEIIDETLLKKRNPFRMCVRSEEGGHNYQVAGVFNCPTVIGARIVQLCSRCGKPNVVDIQTMRDDGQMPLPGFPIPEGKPS